MTAVNQKKKNEKKEEVRVEDRGNRECEQQNEWA